MQDSRRRLWIGTDAGVACYDGYSFVTYTNKKGLPDNTVIKIHEDRKGRIWFSTYSGNIAYYRYDTDSIYAINANQQLSSMIKLFLVDFSFGNGDTLWISSLDDAYLKVFPPAYKHIQISHIAARGFYIREVDKANYIYGVDMKNRPLTQDSATPLIVVPVAGKTLEFTHRNDLSYKIRLSCLKTPHGYLFSEGSSLFDVRDNRLTEINDEQARRVAGVTSLYKNARGDLWAGTSDRGVLYFMQQPSTGNYTFKTSYFNTDVVSGICEDADHGYWFSTTTNGIYYAPSLAFSCYPTSEEKCANKITEMYIDDGRLHYLTGCSSEREVDLKTGNILEGSINRCKTFFHFGHSLIIDDGHSWNIRHPNKSPVDVTWKNRPISLRQVFDYRNGLLYGFGRSRGIFAIDANTGVAKELVRLPVQIYSACWFKNILYIGTKSGLYTFTNNKLTYLGDSHPLLKQRIEALAVSHNSLVIASKGSGVAFYRDGKVYACLDEKNGLANDICKCLATDDAGNVWVGTNKGLSCIQHTADGSYRCITLTTHDGLISNEINQILPHSGKIYYATNNGLGYFNASDAGVEKKRTPLYIEKVYVNNLPIKDLRHKILDHDENFVKIDYKGISFQAEGDLCYRYRLVGLDSTWRTTKSTSMAYTTLPPGDYVFEVAVATNERTIDAQIVRLPFRIRKAFWETYLFMTLLFSLTLFAIYYFIKKRISQVKRNEQEKAQVQQLLTEYELKALRAQMNPHFIFNAINSIQSFVLRNDPKSANKYLTKFSRLIRSILENSRHEFVTLSHECRSLEIYMELECLRANFNFDYEFQADANIATDTLLIPPLIIQPFVENAILHGLMPLSDRRGHLRIGFQLLDDRFLRCTIDDNGIGRKKALELKQRKELNRPSFGMNATHERLNLLNNHKQGNASIQVTDKTTNGIPAGTLVELTIQYLNTTYDQHGNY